MSTGYFRFFSFLAAREDERVVTYRITSVLYKGVAAGLPAQRTGLVKEVVETRDFPEFGEHLDKCVSGARRNRLWIAMRPLYGGERIDTLVHGWM